MLRFTGLLSLLAHGLYTKVEKCEFHKTELLFLGYRIGPWRVGMEENKVAAVSESHYGKRIAMVLGVCY